MRRLSHLKSGERASRSLFLQIVSWYKFSILTCRCASAFFRSRIIMCIGTRDVEQYCLFFFFRRALRTTGLLRLVALSKRGRVSLARRQLQVHVCTWLHGTELHGRHRRVWQEPVQTRYLQEYSRILQVSRTTRLNSHIECVSLSRLGSDYTTVCGEASISIGIWGHFF